MQCELVEGLPLDVYPQQDFAAGEVVLSRHVKTDRLLLVLLGSLKDPSLRHYYGPGDLPQLVDFFSEGHFRDKVIANGPVRVLWIPRFDLCELLTKQAPLTWSLARMLAIERRSATLELQ